MKKHSGITQIYAWSTIFWFEFETTMPRIGEGATRGFDGHRSHRYIMFDPTGMCKREFKREKTFYNGFLYKRSHGRPSYYRNSFMCNVISDPCPGNWMIRMNELV